MIRGRISFAAMLVGLAAAHAASARAVRATFTVGASVVATGRLSSSALASGGAIEVRVSGHRSSRAALFVNGQTRPIEDSPAILPAPAVGVVLVTILY